MSSWQRITLNDRRFSTSLYFETLRRIRVRRTVLLDSVVRRIAGLSQKRAQCDNYCGRGESAPPSPLSPADNVPSDLGGSKIIHRCADGTSEMSVFGSQGVTCDDEQLAINYIAPVNSRRQHGNVFASDSLSDASGGTSRPRIRSRIRSKP